jgi:hypothetical protein
VGLNLTLNTVTRNLILPDGRIWGLDLEAGDSLIVRDDDALATSPHRGLAPPRPPISVKVFGRISVAEGGVLKLLFDADNWDSQISFEPGVPVQLGGALELTFVDDVDLLSQVGRTLRIFDWTGVSPSGQFEIRSPYVWDLTNLYTTGKLTLIAVPEPATVSIVLVCAPALVACCRFTNSRSFFVTSAYVRSKRARLG